MVAIPSPTRGAIVRQAQAWVFRAPLLNPFRIATGQHDRFENPFLRIELDDGTVGWGEAGVAPHISGETLAGTLANLKRAAAALTGRDVTDYIDLAGRFRAYFEGNPAGLAAFEMAVLDAVARSCGFPFWRYFGDRPVPGATDITLVLGSVREAETATREFWGRGFRSFKIKIGTDEVLDLERVTAVARRAPGAALLLDANQAFDAPGMLRFLRALRKRDVRPQLLEQPVPRDDWDGLARLTRESGVGICLDESARCLADVVCAVRMKAANAVNVKLAKTGVLEAAEIARFARAAGLKLMIGAMLESGLSIAAGAHFAAGFGAFDFVDLDTTYFIRGPLSRCPFLDAAGGFNLADAGPGIGVSPRAGRRVSRHGGRNAKRLPLRTPPG